MDGENEYGPLFLLFGGRGLKPTVLRAHFVFMNFKTLEKEFKAQEEGGKKNKQSNGQISKPKESEKWG